MRSTGNYALVLVTAPDLKAARKLARSALRARLVACAILVPRIESHYWWRGEIASGAEVLILFKTLKPKLVSLEKCILQNHPYDTPEVIVLPITAGNQRYLDWIATSTK